MKLTTIRCNWGRRRGCGRQLHCEVDQVQHAKVWNDKLASFNRSVMQ